MEKTKKQLAVHEAAKAFPELSKDFIERVIDAIIAAVLEELRQPTEHAQAVDKEIKAGRDAAR